MPQTSQSQQSKTAINEEEARTELLATMAAARELGPEMDETLAIRYVERFETLFPDPLRDQARLRNDVEALLASARSHGADADAARVKDFLARARAPQPAPPVVVQRPASPTPVTGYARHIPMLIGMAVIIAVIVATHGAGFWLLFLLPLIFGGGNRRRRRMRYRRYGYWDDGYGPTMPPNGSRRQLPPGDGPEIL